MAPKPKTAEKMTKDLYIKWIPKQLYLAFKARCSIKGISMREKIIHAMRTFALEEDK